MARAEKVGMERWGALVVRCVFFAGASIACTENDNAPPSGSGDGGTGGSGVLASGGGISGNGGFGACVSPATDADAGEAPLPHGELGFAVTDLPLTRDGQVSSVAADRVDIRTDQGPYTFVWRGPALDTAFAVDDAVQIFVTAYTGYSGTRLSALRSSTATAVVMDGQPLIVMDVEAGSTATLQGLTSEFPELVYGLVSCCSGRGAFGITTWCDYAALQAAFGGSSTAIPLGSTGEIGPWSVTNLQSRYIADVEHTWDIQVTLLGPATPRSVDGGI